MGPVRQDKPMVLIADDHPVHRMLAAAQFEALGFDVRLVEDGLGAALAAYHERFDIIVLDRHMPRWDGDHAAEVIRDPASASHKALLVCHSSDPPATVRGGPYDMIVPKPLSPGALRDVVGARVSACATLNRLGQAPCDTCPFGALDERPTRLPAVANDRGPAAPCPFPRSLARLRTRDLEVVCCLACGDDVLRIARFVGASPSTVRDAMRRATSQLGLDNVGSLRRLAKGLLETPPQTRAAMR